MSHWQTRIAICSSFCKGTFDGFLLCIFILSWNICLRCESAFGGLTFHISSSPSYAKSYLIWKCILLRHKVKFTLCSLITPHYIILNRNGSKQFCSILFLRHFTKESRNNVVGINFNQSDFPSSRTTASYNICVHRWPWMEWCWVSWLRNYGKKKVSPQLWFSLVFLFYFIFIRYPYIWKSCLSNLNACALCFQTADTKHWSASSIWNQTWELLCATYMFSIQNAIHDRTIPGNITDYRYISVKT